MPVNIYAATAIDYTIIKSVNLREGAGTQYKKLRVLSPGQQIQVIGRSSDGIWLRISEKGKPLGYIHKNFAVLSSSSAARTPKKGVTSTGSYIDNLLRGKKPYAVKKPQRQQGVDSMLSGLNEEIEMAKMEREIEAEIRAEKARLAREQRLINEQRRMEERSLRRELEREREKAAEEERERQEAEERAEREQRRRYAEREERHHDREMQRNWEQYWSRKNREADQFGKELQRDQAKFNQAYRYAQSENSRRQQEYEETQRQAYTDRYNAKNSSSRSSYDQKMAVIQRESERKQKALEEKKRQLDKKYAQLKKEHTQKSAKSDAKEAQYQKNKQALLERENKQKAQKLKIAEKRIANHKKQQDQQRLLNEIKSGTRLAAKNCFGEYHVSGSLPKTASSVCIDVEFRYWCNNSPTAKRSGILKNFVGEMAGCFGDTVEIERLSCKARDITVGVSNVKICGT